MGFVTKKTSEVLVNAYYTQKGRSLFASGTDAEKVITYFSFGDKDINYNLDINDITAKILVPDLTGDVDDCLKSISEDTIINPVYYNKPLDDNSFVSIVDDNGDEIALPTTSSHEVRLNNQAKNFIKVEVDLFKYISYLKTFGGYSSVLDSQYNTNDFSFKTTVPIVNNINVYDNTLKTSIPNLRNILSIELSSADYNTFKQYNRFLLSDTFTLTEPLLNYQTPPIQFIFDEQKNVSFTVNNRTIGYGVWSVVNNVYTLKSFVSLSELLNNNNVLDVDVTDQTMLVRPTVNVNYVKDNKQQNEYFIIREDYLTKFKSNSFPNNQYGKAFVDPNNNKTLIYRESELLESYVINRVDLFDNISTVYTSKPFNLRFVSETNDVNIKDGVVKVVLKYDTSTVYTPSINDTFITIS
jgi:hypothetical protein